MKTLKSYEKPKREIVDIHEEFVTYNTKSLDSKHRITLGGKLVRSLDKQMKVDSYQVFIAKNGDILLRPMANIPSKELWVHQNPDVLESIHRGMQDIKEGRVTKVKNLDKFFKEL
ncbi:MAG: hypothetical protein Q8N76_04910 [Candidatus Omnitrophota bacterium]|nr:hypothetical protein [Candidatus Omnitrophota bacterium]